MYIVSLTFCLCVAGPCRILRITMKLPAATQSMFLFSSVLTFSSFLPILSQSFDTTTTSWSDRAKQTDYQSYTESGNIEYTHQTEQPSKSESLDISKDVVVTKRPEETLQSIDITIAPDINENIKEPNKGLVDTAKNVSEKLTVIPKRIESIELLEDVSDPKTNSNSGTQNQEINILIGNLYQSRNSEPHPKVNAIQKLNRFRKPVRKEETTTQKVNPRYDENTGVLIEEGHPCHRECKVGEPPMICYYHFQIEWYQTMSKACYDCPYNESDCFRPDCIPADGMNRPITVINRKMPGPAIEVCQHDRVIVDVVNDLMVEGTTIHWHGHHQRGTPYMDGTPYVTQCPILPESTFRYQFNASHAGTHFWHSHAGMQRADGAAGAMIVRKPKQHDRHARLYDFDKSEHTMLVTDWVHELSISSFTDHHHSSGDNKPPGLLVNGIGRFALFNRTEKPVYMKAARFNVEKDYRYRFRVINAEFLNCPIELSVDDHNITIIASDGYDLVPRTATSLVTYAGERFDFVLHANAEIDNYWIRVRGLMDCDERFTKAKQVAVLHYEGALEREPDGELTWEESHNDGMQINALNKGEEDEETVSMSEMRSLDGDIDGALQPVADYQFYVSYDFYPKNNTHFHKSPYYGYYQVPDRRNRLYTPQFNHISMKLPSSPLLLARPPADRFCNSTSVGVNCKQEYCECQHVLSVKTGSVVEIIMVDEGVTFDANHPFHLHGHSFRVVGMRRLAKNITVDQVKEFDQAGLLKRNLDHAPIKDTVTVPDGGYTVIRFKADNPGYWLFHCHIEFHAEVGMALVFKIGEHHEMAPVPPNFPTCGDFMPDNMLELATTETQRDLQGPHISINHFWPLVYFNSTSAAAALSLNVFVLGCTVLKYIFV